MVADFRRHGDGLVLVLCLYSSSMADGLLPKIEIADVSEETVGMADQVSIQLGVRKT